MKFVGRMCSVILVLALALAGASAQEEKHDDVNVEISPECAAALIGTRAAVAAGAAYTLTPAAMCSAGFCSAGIAKGTFAAWWQSTMPLVAKGSVFAQLQSIAMMDAGTKITIAAGSAIGGLTGSAYLKDVCAFVDETDPDSGAGKAIAISVTAGRAIIMGKEFIGEKCAASETCMAAVEAAWKDTITAFTFAREKGNEAKERFESECASSELCTAGMEVGAAVKKFASLLGTASVESAWETADSASNFASEMFKEAKEHFDEAEVGAKVKKFASTLWNSILEEPEEGTDEKSSSL